MGKRLDIAEQLRRELAKRNKGGESLFQTAMLTEINQAVLSRFLSGKRDIRLKTAATIAEHLRMRLVVDDE